MQVPSSRHAVVYYDTGWWHLGRLHIMSTTSATVLGDFSWEHKSTLRARAHENVSKHQVWLDLSIDDDEGEASATPAVEDSTEMSSRPDNPWKEAMINILGMDELSHATKYKLKELQNVGCLYNLGSLEYPELSPGLTTSKPTAWLDERTNSDQVVARDYPKPLSPACLHQRLKAKVRPQYVLQVKMVWTSIYILTFT